MEFRLLGPLEVREGERVLPLGGVKRRAVVAQLLLDANRVVPAERLIAAVWGDEAPETAQAALHNQLSRLRRVLAARLETREGGYLLRVEPGELDLDRFGGLVAEARTAEPEMRATLLREALSLWRGRPLEDLVELPVAVQAAHLEELYASSLEDRVEADLALGRHAALIPELQALVETEPFRESLRGQLIVALYRSGRQAEALEAYEAARRTLVETLGVEPGRQLQELQRAVLRQDASLAPPAPTRISVRVGDGSRELRRLVTVLLADIAGGEAERDIEGRREGRRQRFEAASRPVELRGGTAERVGSERLCGVFGVPIAHDDDILRAVQAAFEITSLTPGSRVGLATGEVIAGGRAAGEPLVIGDALDEAERLRAAATAAGILADERTWRLVRHAVSGRPADGGWLLERLDPEAPALPRRLGTPLVGRERELAEIVRAFDRAVSERRAQLMTILGPPGIGKTRLALEAAAALRDRATSAVGYCRAYGENGTYAPLADVALRFGGADADQWIAETMAGDSDRAMVCARIAAAIGAGSDHGPPEEIAWAARRLFETIARTRPLVLVVEDAQWAAPALLELVDHLVDLGRGSILVLALARPELLEQRPGWGGGMPNRSSMALEPLSDTDAELLLARLEPEGALDADQQRRVLAAAEGNPLFLEQLLAAAVEGDAATVPDSIHALIAARLDRLPGVERETVEAAAVCGTRFSTSTVADLVGNDPRPPLVALTRREFVQPGDDDTWMFRHALIRDEAYRMIPKRRRAILHEAYADSVERPRPAGIADLDLLVGRHLAEAVSCRRDLGESNAALRRLAGKAGERLAAAGLRAFDRSEPTAAVSLLGEAVELLPRRSGRRAELLLKLAVALSQSGEREREWRVLAEARELAARLANERLQALARVVCCDLELSVERPPNREEMLGQIAAAIPVLEREGDEESLALAHAVRADALECAPRAPGWSTARAEALAAALDHARRAGSHLYESWALTRILLALRHGPVPVPEAIQRTDAILAAAPSSASAPSALTTLAILHAMQGRFDEARTHAEEARRLLHELGKQWQEATQAIARGEVEMIAGDAAAAEALLREAYERSIAFEDRHARANAAWRLALVLTRLDHDDEAQHFAQIAAEITPDGGFWADVWWRLVLASIDARHGRLLRAQRLLHEGLALASELEQSGMHVDAFTEAATTLRHCDHDDEAVALLERAAAIAQRLGYEVALRRARAQLSEIMPPARDRTDGGATAMTAR